MSRRKTPFRDPAVRTKFHVEGSRALIFAIDDTIPKDAVSMCLSRALTYHLKRPAKRQA